MGTIALPGIVKATAEDAGCWINEANWGWRGPLRVINIAMSYSMVLDADDTIIFDLAWDDDIDDDITYALPSGQMLDGHSVWGAVSGQDSISTDAEAWLNANVAPEGFSFGWHDGDFMLWSTADWCVASGDACFCEVEHPCVDCGE